MDAWEPPPEEPKEPVSLEPLDEAPGHNIERLWETARRGDGQSCARLVRLLSRKGDLEELAELGVLAWYCNERDVVLHLLENPEVRERLLTFSQMAEDDTFEEFITGDLSCGNPRCLASKCPRRCY